MVRLERTLVFEDGEGDCLTFRPHSEDIGVMVAQIDEGMAPYLDAGELRELGQALMTLADNMQADRGSDAPL